MQGKRKLIAFLVLVAALLLAGWGGFLTDTLMSGMLGGFLGVVGGNAAEHFFTRDTNKGA